MLNIYVKPMFLLLLRIYNRKLKEACVLCENCKAFKGGIVFTATFPFALGSRAEGRDIAMVTLPPWQQHHTLALPSPPWNLSLSPVSSPAGGKCGADRRGGQLYMHSDIQLPRLMDGVPPFYANRPVYMQLIPFRWCAASGGEEAAAGFWDDLSNSQW